MIPWKKCASAVAPDRTELSLWQRGDEWVIRAGQADLMSSRTHASEESLANFGCENCGENARVLIGGLGMGFSLRRALSVLRPDAQIVVAEVVPAIAEWARGPLAAVVGSSLDEPRVSLELCDVATILRASEAAFDAILLDVDNGPKALAVGSNRWLYGKKGLAACARALRPNGRLAVWSASDDPAFVSRLGETGLAVRAIRVRAFQRDSDAARRGARQAIFVADRIAPPPRRRP